MQFKAQTPSFKFSSWLLCITWNLVTFIVVFWWSVSTAFIYTPKHMKIQSSSFSQEGLRIPRIYVSRGVLWFSLLVSFLATLAVHLFLNLIKADGCMWSLASWICKYSTLPHSRAYVVFLHGMLATSVQVQVHKLNSIPNLKCSMYECRGLWITAVWKLTFSVLPIHTNRKWNEMT